MVVAILDFGSQFSHLIARRVRELDCFCELLSCRTQVLPENVVGVILSGGPHSVYDDDAPHVSQAVWQLIRDRALPVLGICYGMQELAHAFGGTVEPCDRREYGKSELVEYRSDDILSGLSEGVVWMSHGDKLTALPHGFSDIASTANSQHAIIANREFSAPPARPFPDTPLPDATKMYGFQFHPEVTHTPQGQTLLRNFVVGVCEASCTWTTANIRDTLLHRVREQVGPTGRVIGAVSGGVDSTVAALLLHLAIGDRFRGKSAACVCDRPPR